MVLKFAKNNNLLGNQKDVIVDFYIPNSKCESGICLGATSLCKKYCMAMSFLGIQKNLIKKC